jgi:hypothetical protein
LNPTPATHLENRFQHIAFSLQKIMNVKLFSLIASATMAGLFVGCSPQGKDADDQASSNQSSQTESRVRQGTNGEIVVTVDTETQKVMGLQVAVLSASQINPEMKGYGRVLDASPLAVLVTELSAAQSASNASEAELKRLKTLAALDNTSERALQAAEAVAAHDRAQAESAKQQLLAGWGTVIAGRADLPAFAQSLVSQDSALVEIFLPAGENLQSSPTGARLSTLVSDTKSVEAQFISPAPMVDPQVQGQGFLFLLNPNLLRLAPGAAVTGFLKISGEPLNGVVVPTDAVVHASGREWVYVQTGDGAFTRTEILTDHPVNGGWFVSGVIAPGQKMVVIGAQQLLSTELVSQLPPPN